MTRTDLALAGAAIIAASGLVAAAINPGREAYAAIMPINCNAAIIAAATVGLAGESCPSAEASGHSEDIAALCRVAGGRTVRQIKALPQCREDAP
jgi:hypothetical protein